MEPCVAEGTAGQPRGGSGRREAERLAPSLFALFLALPALFLPLAVRLLKITNLN